MIFVNLAADIFSQLSCIVSRYMHSTVQLFFTYVAHRHPPPQPKMNPAFFASSYVIRTKFKHMHSEFGCQNTALMPIAI